ncbi:MULTISPECIES: hypothetical protein [unclassified Pseudomonas]|uniref:hypothetical protein n=1 Tax=unclassified Pseudomonas TaxID=196821 RepID=UPI0011ED68F5|nr:MULTISPECIES: hypothetical protein [unclassified Pseudomonas]KAA0947057.1 hypothetical protein FQ182_11980 [Pseudomonas sp. ANT_H4]KAA0953598.1 hypothetical protein FQ186_06205 [Pseudomonas sp. ANT_H14]
MSFYDGIQSRLDSQMKKTTKQLDELLRNPDPFFSDDVDFFETKMEIAQAHFARSEHTRIRHELRKSVLDGMQ